MRVNWDEHDEASGGGPVPAGTYRCRLEEIDDKRQTKNRDEMWHLTFEIVEGVYRGRRIWDNLIFSQAAMPRAKLICSKLGLDTVGTQDIFPRDLIGRQAMVTVDVEEYTSGEGQRKTRNSVAYDGYASVDGTAAISQPPTAPDEDLPDIPF